MFNSLPAQRIWRLKYLIPAVLTVSLSLSFYAIITPAQTVSQAHIQGQFGPLHEWEIIPIAVMLMGDGRVFAYGTDRDGDQGAKFDYVIWNPKMGTGADAFEFLTNTTGTDTFCAAQTFIPAAPGQALGKALIVGGDAIVNNQRNHGNNNVNIFDPNQNLDTLTPAQNMAFKRWYATAVTQPNGNHVVLGGRSSKGATAADAIYAPTPEVRAANGTWRSLSSATSEIAYGENGGASWYYPQTWVNPQGSLFILGHNGFMFKLQTAGTGTLTKYAKTTANGRAVLPSIMFAPGKILSIRRNRVAVVVNINGSGEPVVTSAGTLAKDRQLGMATVLADGRVWVNGGSSTGNSLTGRALDSELWDPNTNSWTTTASAATARLYHSTSLLLPDGSVFTGGGGVPGPLKQQNGEIYFPPYLFKTDGSGQFAPRPEIMDAPTAIGWNQNFSIQADESITKVTLVRAGAATHNFNQETRFFNLAIPQAGNTVTVKSPVSASIAPPGFYLLFVWNAEGVPSEAKIIKIG